MSKTAFQSGDRFFHPESGQECVLVFLVGLMFDSETHFVIFNLESGEPEFSAFNFENLEKELAKGYTQ